MRIIKYGTGIINTHCICRRASVISISLRAAAYPGMNGVQNWLSKDSVNSL